jgi:hypothetical protein
LGKSYPSFQPSYSHEELVEHFLLTPGELELVLKCRGNVNRCGMALLLKTLPHLGYLLGRLDEVPPQVREFVAGQIGLLWDCSKSYPWHRIIDGPEPTTLATELAPREHEGIRGYCDVAGSRSMAEELGAAFTPCI